MMGVLRGVVLKVRKAKELELCNIACIDCGIESALVIYTVSAYISLYNALSSQRYMNIAQLERITGRDVTPPGNWQFTKWFISPQAELMAFYSF